MSADGVKPQKIIKYSTLIHATSSVICCNVGIDLLASESQEHVNADFSGLHVTACLTMLFVIVFIVLFVEGFNTEQQY